MLMGAEGDVVYGSFGDNADYRPVPKIRWQSDRPARCKVIRERPCGG